MLSYPLILFDAEEFSAWGSKYVIQSLEHNHLPGCLINIWFPLKLGSAMEVAGGGISGGLISPHFLIHPQM